MALTNWLSRVPNPFNLRVPPASFLTELAAFDADLVLYPSQQEWCYRLARRARLSGGLQHSMEFGPDSKVCVQHKLVPVTTFGGGITFGAQVFQFLADRDTWRFGGAKAVNQILDQQDAHQAQTQRRDRDSENVARARSMYRTYKRRVGERVVLNDVHRGRGIPKAARPRTHNSGPMPPTATPAGWQSSASGLVLPPTL